jgi:hypothetical protein
MDTNPSGPLFETYGVVYNVRTRAWEGLTEEVWAKMVAAYASKKSASLGLGVNRDTLDKWESRFGNGWPKSRIPVEFRPQINGGGDLHWKERLAAQQGIKDSLANYTGKLTSIACLHSWMIDVDYIGEMIDREDGDLGVLVLNGDTLDFNNFSLFRKEYDIDPMYEINRMAEFINGVLKKHTSRILITTANHDARYDKRLAEFLPPDMQKVYRALTDNSTPIDLLVEKANIEGTRLFYLQLGNVMFCHPETGLVAPLKTAQRLYDYFSNRFEGIEVLVLNHLHRCVEGMYRKAKLMEGGCMCRTPDYTMTTGRVGPIAVEPMYVSYATMDYFNGNADVKSARLQYLGETR